MASKAGREPRRSGDRAYGEHLADCFDMPEPGLNVQRTLQRGTTLQGSHLVMLSKAPAVAAVIEEAAAH